MLRHVIVSCQCVYIPPLSEDSNTFSTNMGWLWSSSNDDETNKNHLSKPEPAKKLDLSLTEEQRQRMFGESRPLQSADQSRDAQADKELESFLNSLSAGSEAATAESPTTLPTTQQPQKRTNHDRIRPDGTLNISPDALYPRTMSCRDAFDHAFYCSSLGGKFMDVYRFGTVQSCSDHWAAFRFCMRTRTLPKEERERRIVDHYAERDERREREFGSSERVWEMREGAVERAFGRDPDVETEAEEGRMGLRE